MTESNIKLRLLTCQERIEAMDPDASTSAPWPEGSMGVHCIHRCEEDTEFEDDEPEHPLGCTCIYCIPGA